MNAEKFSKELCDLMEWEEQETEKIFARLKSEGKVIGLDGYPEEFAAIQKERRRRWRELLEKYRPLPLGTKIKLASSEGRMNRRSHD